MATAGIIDFNMKDFSLMAKASKSDGSLAQCRYVESPTTCSPDEVAFSINAMAKTAAGGAPKVTDTWCCR
jgi:hypothetical protein